VHDSSFQLRAGLFAGCGGTANGAALAPLGVLVASLDGLRRNIVFQYFASASGERIHQPLSLSVPVGQTASLTATVGNSTNPVVAWEVNGVIGGDATHGKSSSTGVYTAPSVIPNPAAVTVAAIAQANQTPWP
jgi:hypothetical protein